MRVANHWTLVAHRGALVLIFALMALLSPETSIAWFAPFMLLYAMADGVLTIAGAARAAHNDGRWAWLFFEGLAGITGIVLVAVWPEARIPMLTWSLSGWAAITAVGAIIMSATLGSRLTRKWLLAAAAVVFFRFAILAVGATRAGEFTIAFGSWAGSVVFTLLFLAILLRPGFRSRQAALRERFAR